MLITIYHSERDINGNSYHAIELSRLGKVLMKGKFDCGDINYSDLYRNGIEITEKELSIKEYKKYVKDLPYFGDRWEDIKKVLWID